MVAPTFDVETIIFAELQAKYIKAVKSAFDSHGHYARWDLVNLTTPPQPYEPLTDAPVAAAAARRPSKTSATWIIVGTR